MELKGTHVRQNITAAFVARGKMLEPVHSVYAGTAVLPEPIQGPICDITLLAEKSMKTSGLRQPNSGTLERMLEISVIFSTRAEGYPNGMAMEDFEGSVLGDFERLMTNAEELAPFADDWFLSETQYKYAKDIKFPTVSAAQIWTVIYQTPVTDPGEAL